MNIVLIGMRATGKTTVAKIIAKKLQRDIVEIDDLVVARAGISIAEMVEKFGWEYFRDLESEVLKEIEDCKNCVVSTGGGVVMRTENIEALKKIGFLIHLTARIDSMMERIGEGSIRPSLTEKKSMREEVVEILEMRKAMYESACDMRVATDNLPPDAVADEIMKIITEKIYEA